MEHPLFARFYAWQSVRMEAAGVLPRRRSLLAGLAGRVVEVGAGNGLMFAHYPPAVTEVIAVEPEPRLRADAVAAAERAPVPVRVVEGVAESLPGQEGEFDAAICSLVLCSVPKQQVALNEIRRVLRPGGELRFLEHVIADQPGALRTSQRIADATLWPLLAGGCHTARDTVGAITAAGFAVGPVERFRLPDHGFAGPAGSCVSGVALAPEARA